ncbi:MAG TPA: discoidin domain-containing protein [Anaeromyxobacter sp.]
MQLVPTVFLSAALAAAPAVSAAPIRLQALTATSGAAAEALLDGRVESGWRPEGDPADEGVLFRFEEPTRVDGVEIAPCGGARTPVEVYVNGRRDPQPLSPAAGVQQLKIPGRSPKVQSLFVKIGQERGGACIGEVRFMLGGQALPVLPPRRVAGRVEASSTLAPAAAYHPSYLFDARLDFGWVEGSKGNGEGEAVTVELDEPLEIAAMEVWNGYQRSPVHFQKNARARKVTLSLDDGPPMPFELRDAEGAQKLALATPIRARKVRLAIVSVFPGSKYPDLVVSELRFWDAAGPVGVAVKDRAELAAALARSVKGTAVGALLGRRLSNACSYEPDQPRTMKLRPDHTFVMYEQGCFPEGGCAREVFDGTWVPTTPRGDEIELFGRRHRTDESWDPYADGNPRQVKETDRIAGGRVSIRRLRDVPEAAQEGLMDTGGCRHLLTTGPEREVFSVSGAPLTDVLAVDAR